MFRTAEAVGTSQAGVTTPPRARRPEASSLRLGDPRQGKVRAVGLMVWPLLGSNLRKTVRMQRPLLRCENPKLLPW